ncbi:hypothetical protein CDD83_5672 [Cordyceps sp. RAO-2017]|nr:hypothetical protein CDD83_5672 [Cordyceps sp. RAO-2017]
MADVYPRRIPRPTPELLIAALVGGYDDEDLDEHWAAYQRGTTVSIEAFPEQVLALMPRNEVQIGARRTPRAANSTSIVENGGGAALANGGSPPDVLVVHLTDINAPMGVSFFTWDVADRRFAFHGELRLLRRAFNILRLFFERGRFTEALIRPAGMLVPILGFNPGLDRGAFEDRLKFVDCVLFVREQAEDYDLQIGLFGTVVMDDAAFAEATLASALEQGEVGVPNGPETSYRVVGVGPLRDRRGAATPVPTPAAADVDGDGANGGPTPDQTPTPRYNLRRRDRPNGIDAPTNTPSASRDASRRR